MNSKILFPVALMALLPGPVGFAERGATDDAQSERQVEARYRAFNDAWKARDLSFIDGYYAHDPDMLLFFERRQLRGWEKVKTLYQNMFAHALPGSVKSSYSNLQVRAKGDMAFVAANFHLEVKNPEGEVMTDTGRQSAVFERRDGDWVVVHRHTSFQAPPGPQRRVPLHSEPGPLWSPNLEGAWEGEGERLLVASGSYLSASGIEGVPSGARYRREGDAIQLTSLSDGATSSLKIVELSGSSFSFRAQGSSQVITLTRAE